MQSKILYNDIKLPEKVSDILELDFWILENVNSLLVKTVKNPVKFSAFTSIFVTKGICEAEINLVNHKITAPAVVNITSGDIVLPHNVSEDFTASFVVLSKRLIDTVVGNIKDAGIFSIMHAHPVLAINEQDSGKVEKLYTDLKEIANDKDNQHTFESILHTILAHLYRNSLRLYDKFRQNVPASLNNRIADNFIRLVQEHFKQERFLDFYAGELGITPKHLSRTVKAQTGVSAVEWINRHVILEAKVMLRSSNLNIQQIAEELNFTSQSIFGKYFKKITGVSPKDFRNFSE